MLYLEKYKKYKFIYQKQRGGVQCDFADNSISLYHTNELYIFNIRTI